MAARATPRTRWPRHPRTLSGMPHDTAVLLSLLAAVCVFPGLRDPEDVGNWVTAALWASSAEFCVVSLRWKSKR
jgi:hypothetical protein